MFHVKQSGAVEAVSVALVAVLANPAAVAACHTPCEALSEKSTSEG
jgi:hypothetical protein